LQWLKRCSRRRQIPTRPAAAFEQQRPGGYFHALPLHIGQDLRVLRQRLCGAALRAAITASLAARPCR